MYFNGILAAVSKVSLSLSIFKFCMSELLHVAPAAVLSTML